MIIRQEEAAKQIYDPGLAVTNAHGKHFTIENNRKTTVRIKAKPNASLAEREIRVMTPYGVSNPLKLFVGQWPEILEKESNDTRDTAQVIQLPATVRGAIQKPEDRDVFRFTSAKGKTLIFEVVAARRDSHLRSILTIHDRNGKKLTENANHLGHDSLIRFTAPEDGDYFLEIRDTRQQGGEQFHYQIHAGPVLYLESIFPLGTRQPQMKNRSITDLVID